MDIATITTAKDLDLSNSFSHLYMVLSWLCKEDPLYKSYWMNIHRNYKDAYVILDNGANENKLSSDMEIINVAYDISADEIITPDVYQDTNLTIEKTNKFLETYYDKYIRNKFKVMSVLQGRTKDEFLKCFEHFINDPRINVLGVGYRNLMQPFKDDMSKMSNEEWTNIGVQNIQILRNNVTEDTFYYTLSRVYFLRKILDCNKLTSANKKIHLLGLMNPYELSLYKKVFNNDTLDLIRGCDSACLSQAAQAGVLFAIDYGVRQKPKAILDFETGLTSHQKILFNQNLDTVKRWL